MSLRLARDYEHRLAIERQIATCTEQISVARAMHNKKREKALLRRLSRLRARSDQWTVR